MFPSMLLRTNPLTLEVCANLAHDLTHATEMISKWLNLPECR